jgi:hypothetical protein
MPKLEENATRQRRQYHFLQYCQFSKYKRKFNDKLYRNRLTMTKKQFYIYITQFAVVRLKNDNRALTVNFRCKNFK